MAACVEYTQEDVSSAKTMERENADELALFDDFSGVDLNYNVLPESNHLRVTLGSESANQLIPETKSIIIYGQDPGADDVMNSVNNSTGHEWVLSSLEMDEHTTHTNHILISNGQSISPKLKLENPNADCISTTNVASKLPTTSSNGLKSSNGAIRRPSPTRKTPSTVKQSKSFTSTPRAALTTATKSVGPIKRSTTPTPRPSILPVAMSASRSSTPTQRPAITATAKSASRSSTPTQRPAVTATAKLSSRSSTPTQRPAVTATAKSASRSSTPSQRPVITATTKSASRSSTPTQRPAVTATAKSASRSSTPTQRPAVTAAARSASRSSTPTTQPSNPKRTSCSPSRRLVSNVGGNNIVKSGVIRGHGSMNRNDDDDDDDVNPVLIGTKMVERVVNMRKLAPPKQEHISNQNYTSGKLSVSQENSGFGRSLSKKSFDMALRHLDIRRSMPGNMRAMITKIPASSVYSVRPESTKTQTNTTSCNEQQ